LTAAFELRTGHRLEAADQHGWWCRRCHRFVDATDAAAPQCRPLENIVTVTVDVPSRPLTPEEAAAGAGLTEAMTDRCGINFTIDGDASWRPPATPRPPAPARRPAWLGRLLGLVRPRSEPPDGAAANPPRQPRPTRADR
jgi:hypothetical protein